MRKTEINSAFLCLLDVTHIHRARVCHRGNVQCSVIEIMHVVYCLLSAWKRERERIQKRKAVRGPPKHETLHEKASCLFGTFVSIKLLIYY